MEVFTVEQFKFDFVASAGMGQHGRVFIATGADAANVPRGEIRLGVLGFYGVNGHALSAHFSEFLLHLVVHNRPPSSWSIGSIFRDLKNTA